MDGTQSRAVKNVWGNGAQLSNAKIYNPSASGVVTLSKKASEELRKANKDEMWEELPLF